MELDSCCGSDLFKRSRSEQWGYSTESRDPGDGGAEGDERVHGEVRSEGQVSGRTSEGLPGVVDLRWLVRSGVENGKAGLLSSA